MKERVQSILMYPKELQKFLGMSRNQTYLVRKDKAFPAARYPVGKRPMYLTEEVMDWARRLNPAFQSDSL